MLNECPICKEHGEDVKPIFNHTRGTHKHVFIKETTIKIIDDDMSNAKRRAEKEVFKIFLKWQKDNQVQ